MPVCFQKMQVKTRAINVKIIINDVNQRCKYCRLLIGLRMKQFRTVVQLGKSTNATLQVRDNPRHRWIRFVSANVVIIILCNSIIYNVHIHTTQARQNYQQTFLLLLHPVNLPNPKQTRVEYYQQTKATPNVTRPWTFK